uniref:Protein CNPPD1 n=1 Tax=Saccoglossus kowalevskii TaxID=10224 RepID=A0ABM0GTY2_SACKO|nr:PREDICTED: protein CNPPD1-like [Saccoglossus kowalevskii]
MDFSSPFDVMGLPRSDLENYEDFPGHTEFTERLRKTLYYGSDPDTDQPSLPVTDIAIDLFQDASPSPHKKIDKNFASRISRKSSMSPCAFMLSMVYIERMKRTNPEYLVKISSADLFLVSMMIASKYLYDEGEEEEMYNDEWAEAAGIDVDTVNEMEIDFLAAIDWNLYIKPVEFFQFLHKIETRIAIQEGNKRGWFSYTDLLVLLEGQNFHNIFMNAINQTVQVASICALMYGMCAAAMIGSSALALQSTMSTAPLTEIPIPVLEPTYLMPIYHSGTGVARFVSRGCFTPGNQIKFLIGGHFVLMNVVQEHYLRHALTDRHIAHS